jgi:hypothetical protein
VTLVFFEVTRIEDHRITLAWATASELNFDKFIVLRSGDGEKFVPIGTIKGNGTSKARHDYVFADENPLHGNAYYKLVSVDFDGFTESFKVISVMGASTRDATLYPVPLTGSALSVHLNFLPSEPVEIAIADLTGLEVFRGTSKAGENQINIDFPAKPGYYIVKMKSSELTKAAPLLVK